MPQESLSFSLAGQILSASLIRRKGSRSVRLAVHQDGVFSIRAPQSYTLERIQKMIQEKATWIERQQAAMQKRGVSLHAKEHEQDRRAYLQYKEAARRLIERRLPELNQLYQFDYKRVAIKDNRTNWGSCSKAGNLNFNYKLVLLPDHLADYVIVHELCHLKEMNHSIRFWNLVAQGCPNWKRCRTELKKTAIQALLHQTTPSSAV